MGRLLVAIVVASGCGGRGGEPTRVAREAAVEREAEASPVTGEPRRGSCRSQVAASRVPLSHAAWSTTIGERTFVVGWRGRGAEVETVIGSLDAGGALVVTPVPVRFADPLAIGGDPKGLVIVSVAPRGAATLLRVALGEDGGLRPGAPVPLPEVGWGWPARVVSDGTQVTLHHTMANPEQTLGSEVIYKIEVATGRVLSTMAATTGMTTHCHAGACTTVAVSGEGRTRVTRRGPGGEASVELTIASACPTLYPLTSGEELVLVAPGDPWQAVIVGARPPLLGAAAIAATLAPTRECGPALHAFPSMTRPGLVAGDGDGRRLLIYDGARRRFGEAEALPELNFRRWRHAAHADGVIEVGWEGGSGMMHSPTDAKGIRRYFKRWYFQGGAVRLLRRKEGRWTASEVMPLALTGAEGRMHDGYAPLVLRHGLHAAVLLTPDGGGEEAWFQPYLGPCADSEKHSGR